MKTSRIRRQPTQISGGETGLYALANDGTIWWLRSHDPAYWVLLPELPQPDPKLLEVIPGTNPATLLGELLQEFLGPASRLKESASRIYDRLLSDPSWRLRLEKICRSFGRFVQLMFELSKQERSGVNQGRSHGGRYYEIEKLQAPERVA
jgi:hypothetical protein